MRSELSYDGCGINGPDEFRSRIATFTNSEAAQKYGPIFEAAPALLKAVNQFLAEQEAGQCISADTIDQMARAALAAEGQPCQR